MQEPTPSLSTDTDQALLVIESGSLAILKASRHARSVLGYSDGELEAMSFADVFLHPPAHEVESLLSPLGRSGEGEIACAALLRNKGGRAIATELLFVRIDTPERPLLAAIVHLAGTRRRAAGGPRLDPDDAAFVEFVSRLGHDMNNLLGTVIGSLALIGEDGPGVPGDDTRQLVDDALSASRECADILDRLMAAAGKQPLNPKRLAANAVIQRLTPLLNQTLPTNVELRVSLAPDLPDIYVDPDRLEAAMIALVVNAREAMPSGGELVISSAVGEATEAQPALEPGRDYVQISVSDSGPGIPEDLVERVSEPLFTTKPGATGLGLSMVNGFVRQSRGALSLDSESARGTRVTLSFPPAE
jgi:signal transduction histidine kinase